MKTFKVSFSDEIKAESEEGAVEQLREYIESLNDTIGHIPIDVSAFEFEEATPKVITGATEALTESVLEDISNEYLDDE